MEGSIFLQFLFNQLEQAKRQKYLGESSRGYDGLGEVTDELARTVRVIFSDKDKNKGLRKIITDTIKTHLGNINQLRESEIEAVMSLVHETSFLRLSTGSPCINQDGMTFTMLGVIKKRDANLSNEQVKLFSSFAARPKSEPIVVAGLFHDPKNPEKRDLIKDMINHATPILDLEIEKTKEAARLSIFMDVPAMRSVLKLLLVEESSLTDEKAKRKSQLVKTYLARGIYNVSHSLKNEFITFLETRSSLLTGFMKFLFGS